MYSSLARLMDDLLQDLHAAEAHIARELPRLIQGASSMELKSALEKHLTETEEHARRLDDVLEGRGVSPRGKHCRVVDVLLKEGAEIAERRGDERLLDLGLLVVMRQIENYERCAYDTTRTIAEALGASDVVSVVDRNAREDEEYERFWTVLSEDMIDTAHTSPITGEAVKTAKPGEATP